MDRGFRAKADHKNSTTEDCFCLQDPTLLKNHGLNDPSSMVNCTVNSDGAVSQCPSQGGNVLFVDDRMLSVHQQSALICGIDIASLEYPALEFRKRAKAEPAVVKIYATRTIVGGSVPAAIAEPFYRRFPNRDRPQPQEREVEGNGSGFTIDPRGQILTNAHVVNKADKVMVRFSDDRMLEGKVLGEDPVIDVAVVQVQANNLPTVELGNSDQVVSGQWANAAYDVAQASQWVALSV